MYIVVTSVIILFALIFLGFFIGKREIIRKECTPDLSNFILKVTMPVTVFCSMIQQTSLDGVRLVWQIVVLALIFHGVTGLIGFAVVKIGKIPPKERGIWMFNCMFTNNGFMGFPLALSIFGDKGLFLMAIANVISNLLIFSVGLKFCTKDYPVKENINLKKMLVNNINIAVVIGFVFYLGQITVPEVILKLLNYISSITAGLSMIVVGLSLSRMEVRNVFVKKRLFLLAAIRLLALPLLCIGVFALLPIKIDETMKAIIILMSALPAASSQTMLTEQYRTNIQDAGRCVFLTTLFSVVTVPLMMAVGLVH